ncbi:hypothetical protein BGM26_02965 [Bacillus sp. FJAT-29790]|nr:hypothetical protein [Bacillus sp. FJAT-29790]MBU8877953.1 hypothetical protein [Bacillus sp. FJAT-29790]
MNKREHLFYNEERRDAKRQLVIGEKMADSSLSAGTCGNTEKGGNRG